MPEGEPRPNHTGTEGGGTQGNERKSGWVQSIKARMQRFVEGITKEPPQPPYTAASLIREGGMYPFSAYYSGVPGRLEDLNGERLMRMYYGLSIRKGEQAAQDFARMIQDMPSLAPSNVIGRINDLEANNWIYDPEKAKGKNESKYPADFEDVHNEAREITGLGAWDAALHEPDQTAEIKQQFQELLDASDIKINPPRIIDNQ